MAPNTRTAFVFLECVNPDAARRAYLAALGIGNILCYRWDLLPAQISPANPCSIDVAIPDFNGAADLALLQQCPGVVRVAEFSASAPLPDPLTSRHEYFRAAVGSL